MKFAAPIVALLLAGSAALKAAAPPDCWQMRKDGKSEFARTCFEGLTRSPDAYSRAEGFWGLEEWEQANEQFRLAAQPADGNALVKVRWGMLLHERFNDQDAADLFREALTKDPTNANALPRTRTRRCGWL